MYYEGENGIKSERVIKQSPYTIYIILSINLELYLNLMCDILVLDYQDLNHELLCKEIINEYQ